MGGGVAHPGGQSLAVRGESIVDVLLQVVREPCPLVHAAEDEAEELQVGVPVLLSILDVGESFVQAFDGALAIHDAAGPSRALACNHARQAPPVDAHHQALGPVADGDGSGHGMLSGPSYPIHLV